MCKGKKMRLFLRMTFAYRELFWSSTTVELQNQIGFVVPLVDLKHALFPSGRAQFQTAEANADSASAGQLGHCNGHECVEPDKALKFGALNVIEDEQMRPVSLTIALTMERKRGRGERRFSDKHNNPARFLQQKT